MNIFPYVVYGTLEFFLLFFVPSSISAKYLVLIAENGHGKDPQLTTFLRIIVCHLIGIRNIYNYWYTPNIHVLKYFSIPGQRPSSSIFSFSHWSSHLTTWSRSSSWILEIVFLFWWGDRSEYIMFSLSRFLVADDDIYLRMPSYSTSITATI